MADKKYQFDVFDIIGPVMVGPSSSHTAGAARIGYFCGSFCQHSPASATISFHGSLAKTYRTHKTDLAVIGGLIGFKPDDVRIRNAFDLADEKGVQYKFQSVDLGNAHPNTILIDVLTKDGFHLHFTTITVGGGNIEITSINGIPLSLDGKQPVYYKLNGIDASTETLPGLISIDGKLRLWVGEAYKGISQQGFREIAPLEQSPSQDMRFYKSFSALEKVAKKQGKRISDLTIAHESKRTGLSEAELLEKMGLYQDAMLESIESGKAEKHLLLGGIFANNAALMQGYANGGQALIGGLFTDIVTNALAVMEVNGSMGRVVACPTAGSAGTLPAAVLTLAKAKGKSREDTSRALFAAAGVGIIIAENSTISGAVGGCQAETGVAAAMAAASLAELFGSTVQEVYTAISLAIGNTLGTVCDPVGGHVEVPCIQRNTIAAMNAVLAAEMALAGVRYPIPVDEMVSALKEVGDLMHPGLKDTLGAGISNTKTAKKIAQALSEQEQSPADLS